MAKINRRDFFLKSFTALTSVGLAGYTRTDPQENPRFLDKPAIKNGIIYRKLGKTGIEIPIGSMGVMNVRDPVLIKKAYETGIRHFDTAFAYGNGRECHSGTEISRSSHW